LHRIEIQFNLCLHHIGKLIAILRPKIIIDDSKQFCITKYNLVPIRILHVRETSVPVVVHHLLLVLRLVAAPHHAGTLNLGLADRTDDRGWRHLGRPAGHHPRGRSVSNHRRRLLGVDHNSLLVDVLHVRLEVRLLLELFGANAAAVFVVSLPVNADHVSAETALALELLEADVAVVPRSLMLGLNVHVTTARRSVKKTKQN
jgi:hypothetical protein